MSHFSLENMSIEFTLKNVPWSLIALYRPPKLSNDTFIREATTIIDRAYLRSDNVLVAGDLNYNMYGTQNTPVHALSFDLTNLVKEPTCFREQRGTMLDLFLTNRPSLFQCTGSFDGGLSECHHIIHTSTRQQIPGRKPKYISYRSYKHFNEQDFLTDLERVPFQVSEVFDDVSDSYWAFTTMFSEVIDDHAPIKRKKVNCKQMPFVTAEYRKNILRKRMLRNAYLRSKRFEKTIK